MGGVLSPFSKDFSSMSRLAFTPRVNKEEDRDGKSLMYASCTPNHRDNRTSNNFYGLDFDKLRDSQTAWRKE